MGELFGTLGLAWPRLLFYPGGLAALLLAWLLDRALASPARLALPRPAAGDLSAVVAPLLVISLLPLPGAAAFPYTLDLPTALALLEWPAARQLIRAWRSDPPAAALRQAALLRGYGLLLLALLLAQTTGSLRLAALAQVDLAGEIALVIGVGWSLALAPLLGLGPFQTGAGGPDWGLRLRALGHLLLAALPWLPRIGELPWLAALPPLLLAALLGAAARWGDRLGMRQWRALLTGAAAVLAALLAWSAYTALAARL